MYEDLKDNKEYQKLSKAVNESGEVLTLDKLMRYWKLQDESRKRNPETRHRGYWHILGMQFETLSEAARYFEISRDRLDYQIKKYGPNDERILDIPKKKYITIQGKRFKTWTKAGQYFNIAPRTLHYRAEKYGYNNPTTISKKRLHKGLTINDKHFNTIREAAEHFNLKPNTLKGRLHRYEHNDPRLIAPVKRH